MYENGQAVLEDYLDLDIDDYDPIEDVEDLLLDLEEFDLDEDDEDDSERRRRRRFGRRFGRRRRGRRSGLPSKRVTRRSSSSQSALAAAVNKNSATIKKVDTKVNALDAKISAVRDEQKRQMVMMQKARIARKKEMADLKSKLQLLVLLPALTAGSENSTLSLFLPLLILGDLGGSSKGGSDMSTLFLVLALSGSLGGSSIT